MPHSKIGRIYMGEHQFSAAAEEFAQALRFSPSDPNAHDDLGVACIKWEILKKLPNSSAKRCGWIPPMPAQAKF